MAKGEVPWRGLAGVRGLTNDTETENIKWGRGRGNSSGKGGRWQQGGRCGGLRRGGRRWCPDSPRRGKWTEVENRRAAEFREFRHQLIRNGRANFLPTRLLFQNT